MITCDTIMDHNEMNIVPSCLKQNGILIGTESLQHICKMQSEERDPLLHVLFYQRFCRAEKGGK